MEIPHVPPDCSRDLLFTSELIQQKIAFLPKTRVGTVQSKNHQFSLQTPNESESHRIQIIAQSLYRD
ncbi:MAG TPA: hypothetical protein VLE95_06025 [Chlamydiales bacterium]|nr:hypothetical protein [Chlamydiales bacterium]